MTPEWMTPEEVRAEPGPDDQALTEAQARAMVDRPVLFHCADCGGEFMDLDAYLDHVHPREGRGRLGCAILAVLSWVAVFVAMAIIARLAGLF